MAKIPITSRMSGHVCIPFEFMLWIEFRESLNLLKTYLQETLSLERYPGDLDDSNDVLYDHETYLGQVQETRPSLWSEQWLQNQTSE